MRVLLIAEAANPEWVSVPLIGWSLGHALSRQADVHIVTQIRNRAAFLRAGMVEGRDFTAIDNEALAGPMWKLASWLRRGDDGGWTTLALTNLFGYGLFERKVWRKFAGAIRRGDYDLVHRVTPLSPTMVSPLAGKCRAAGVPFILGPINGGVPWPRSFAAEQRRERELLSHVRALHRYRPSRWRMLRSCAAILCGSRVAQAEIPRRFADKVIYMPENGIDPTRFNLIARQDGRLPLRACFIGRLVPLKGLDMAIRAAAPLLRDGRLVFDIIGDGPRAGHLQALARSERVAHGVNFHGWKDHAEVQEIAAGCHILLFPSIREFGGGAVLEAMALGLVPIVVNYGGPGELVDRQTGIRIPLTDRGGIIRDMRQVLEQIAADPARLRPMAQAGRAKVMREFTWQAKATRIIGIWREVLAGQRAGARPLPDGEHRITAWDQACRNRGRRTSPE